MEKKCPRCGLPQKGVNECQYCGFVFHNESVFNNATSRKYGIKILIKNPTISLLVIIPIFLSLMLYILQYMVPELKAEMLNKKRETERKRLIKDIEDYENQITSNLAHMQKFLEISKDAGSISLEFREHNAKQTQLNEKIQKTKYKISKIPQPIDINQIKKKSLTNSQEIAKSIYIIGNNVLAIYIFAAIILLITKFVLKNRKKSKAIL